MEYGELFVGAETLLLVGSGLLTGASVIGGMRTAKKQAEAVVRQGEEQARQRARKTKILAGEQRASFLGSGLTLEGTPMSFIDETFATGLKDTRQILDNARLKSKNIMKQARNDAMGQLAGFALTAATSGGFGAPATASSVGSAATSSPIVGTTNTSAIDAALDRSPAFNTDFTKGF